MSVRICGARKGDEGSVWLSKKERKRVLGVGHPIRKDKGILNMGRLCLAFVSACFRSNSAERRYPLLRTLLVHCFKGEEFGGVHIEYFSSMTERVHRSSFIRHLRSCEMSGFEV